jgi:signal transduction histidine kinase
MRLSALENSTLAEALLATGKQILEGTPIRFDMDVTGGVRQLPYDIQANLYIIAREAINNALNHARPQRVNVELAYYRDSVRLSIEDDGVGFDPDNTPIRQDHWGLAGMRERARLIRAHLTVQSERGHGTRIAVVVDRGTSKSRG